MRLTIIFLIVATLLKAQRDTALSTPIVGIHLGGQIPSGDMVKRFGPNAIIGGSYNYKTNKNWIYGIEYSYMYGKAVKEDVLKQLKTPEGFVVDNAGNPADLRVTERGNAIHLTAGRVFKLFRANRNSGLMINIGAGLLNHKINLYDAQQKVASVRGDLRYGYDRMTFGFSVSQFIGYLYLSNNRFTNFYVGIESSQAWTRSLRKLNYDTGLRDTQKRMDILTGLRFGWILPIYKRQPNDFYYN